MENLQSPVFHLDYFHVPAAERLKCFGNAISFQILLQKIRNHARNLETFLSCVQEPVCKSIFLGVLDLSSTALEVLTNEI